MNFKSFIGAFGRLGALAALLIGISMLFGDTASAQGTTYTWTNVGGGNFEVATNWTPTGVPGPNDTAVFNSNLTYTVNGSRTVNSIIIAGSTVAFTGAVTTSNLSVTTSGGGLIVFSGTFSVNGTGNIASGSVLTLTGGNLAGTGTLTIDGTMNWASTNISLNAIISAGATANTTGSGDRGLTGILTNRGAFNYSAGRITNGAGNGGQFRNENLVDVQFDTSFQFIGNGPTTFLNTATGVLRKTGGTGNLDFNGFPLTNAGTIDVQSGRIRLFNDLMNTGTLMVTGGSSVFEIGNSTTTLSAGTLLTGTGRFQLSSGNLNAATTVSVPNLDLVGGNLLGTGTVTATNNVLWTATLIAAPIIVEAGATMATVGSGDHGLATTLINRGTFNYNGGRITNGGGGGGQFRNENLVDVQTDGAFQFIGNGPTTFLNTATGLLRKSAGTGNLEFNGFPLTNAGTIDVQSGRLRVASEFSNTGTLMVTGGTQVFEFVNSSPTLSAGTSLVGTGRFQLSSANLNVAANVSVPNLDLVGGNLLGTGTVTATGSVLWTQSAIAAPFVVESGATMNLIGGVDRGLAGSLTNKGTVTFSAGRLTNGGGASLFRNEGAFDATSDVSLIFIGGGVPSFVNAPTGLIRKTGGTGPLTFSGWPLTNQGAIDCPRDFRVDTFTQTSTGILNVDIGGTTAITQYDRLQTNSSTLNGTLNLSVSNGFTPALGQVFDIITFNSRTGTIPTVNGKNQGPVAFDPVYLTGSPSSLRLNVINSPCPTITLDPQTLPNPVKGVAYNQTVTATGGTAPYSFLVTFGSLPTGLTLSSAGLISGTPTANGPFAFQITATDANGCNGVINYTLNVACPTITLSPATLPNGSVAVMYSQTITASGGLGNYSFMPVAGTLPPGLVLSGAGVLAGMPTAQGTYQFTVRATDTVTGCFGETGYTVIIGCPTITVSGLTNGTVGSPYSQTLGASGGTAPYSFSLTGGSLPTGLSLASSGAVTGTPTATGSFNFTITATDANGCTGSSPFTISIGCQTITVNPSTLPDGSTGTPYNQTVSAANGQGTVTFSVSGALPTGLTLSGSSGAITGTPTATGTFNFTITATDRNGCTGSRFYTVVITCPTISLSGLPNATVGQSYTQTITASGGAAPYTFTLESGLLPTGLSLNASGMISGTPTAAGTFNFTVTATDASGCTGSRAYTVVANCLFVTLSPATLPSATVGSAYSQTISASGGSAPYTFAVTNGALPATFSLSTAGALTGAPTATGSATFTITATDANGCTGSLVYTLTINPAGACAYTVDPQSLSLPSSGGIGRVTVTTDSGCSFTTSGAPEWITGLAPTGTGTQTLTFTVAANNDTTPRTATLTIAGQSVTVSQAAAVNLNNSVRLSVISQGLVPSTCSANGYAGDFVIQASLTNIGRETIYHGAFLLTQLRPANGATLAIPYRLTSADGATCVSGGLPGSLQTVNLGAGLAPGQSVTVTFTLALSTIQRTIFNVDFQGGSTTPIARATRFRATPSPASQLSGGVVDFVGRSFVENRKENGFNLTLDANFVLPQREVSKPSGL